ncbi:TetR family transcriptional regulator [Kocuria atrinae]|uniref:TetR/AcrR family transcriptional regulator n=1 Tax=Kocuria atrinae TaxID=592377 RepID=A0ABP5J7V1_9MICC
MALSREQIVDAAWGILHSYGLGDLSMRRLAKELGVQPGALYWHVANKQELLGVLAQRMVAPLSELTFDDAVPPLERAAHLTGEFRSLILAVRDGADVVSVAHSISPEELNPAPELATLVTGSGVSRETAMATALTLIRFTLGSVTTQQTREAMGLDTSSSEAEFTAGVELVLHSR